jgi:O-antigen/teichoic acid export membrane protein
VSIIKKLGSETAIYGIPSIVGRFINFLLVFFFAKYFTPELLAPQIEFYAYAAFFFVLLPHGMETAFFNFSREEESYKNVFTTALLSVAGVSSVFLVLLLVFREQVGEFTGYPNNLSYVIWFALILSIDAAKSLPYALLRYLHKAKKFAFVKSFGIALNVGLNIFFIVWYPDLANTEANIEFVFISNLIASLSEMVLLSPSILKHRGVATKELWQRMIRYSWPLVILGFAGMVNETFDRVALKHLLPTDKAAFEIGIYGTFYRLSMLMTIFIQAFRYAAEPFFFSQSKEEDAKPTYALVMSYFLLVCGAIFLGTSLFKTEIARLLITQEEYFQHPDALTIVPILLLANLFLGAYFNLSIWYKLNDKTKMGALIGLIGAVLTVVMLFSLVPHYGFIAAAYTTLAVYASLAAISYFVGQRFYKVPYQVGLNTLTIVVAVLLYFLQSYVSETLGNVFATNALLLVLYGLFAYTIIKTSIKH